MRVEGRKNKKIGNRYKKLSFASKFIGDVSEAEGGNGVQATQSEAEDSEDDQPEEDEVEELDLKGHLPKKR